MYQRTMDDLDSNVREYFERISRHFCPFMAPSHSRNSLRFTRVSVTGGFDELQHYIYALSVVMTEEFRRIRQETTEQIAKLLFCNNLIVDLPSDSGVDVQSLLGWPHWLLKVSYLEVGVMHGKFWVGEREVSRKGEPIPTPPVNFISIRSAIQAKDVQFFEQQRAFLEVLKEATDDGRDVYKRVPMTHSTRHVLDEILAQIRTGPRMHTTREIEVCAHQLAQTTFFEEMRTWGELELARVKSES